MYQNNSFDQLVEKHVKAKAQLDALKLNTFYSDKLWLSVHNAYMHQNERVLAEIERRLEKAPIMALIQMADGKISFLIK